MPPELEIGSGLVPAPVVAVTGTKGKSTTSALCVEMLRAHEEYGAAKSRLFVRGEWCAPLAALNKTAREATDRRGGLRELDDRQIVRELV